VDLPHKVIYKQYRHNGINKTVGNRSYKIKIMIKHQILIRIDEKCILIIVNIILSIIIKNYLFN
jgi:hypothetical protein